MTNGIVLLALAFLAASERRPRRRPARTLPAGGSSSSTTPSSDDALSQYGRSLGSVEVPSGGVARSQSPPVRTPVRDVEQIDVSRRQGVREDELPRAPSSALDDLEAQAQARLLGATQISRPASTPTRTTPAVQPAAGDTRTPGGRQVPEEPPLVQPAGSASVTVEARRAAAQTLYRIATTTAAASRGAYRDRIREAQRVLGIASDGLIGAGTARAVYQTIGLRIPGISF